MKKLLLVSANQYVSPYPVYPLGVSYLHTFLKNRMPDFDIKIFDFNIEDINSFITLLKSYNPDYIGVSIRNIDGVNSYDPNNFIGGYKTIFESIRKNSAAVLIMGGAGYSIFPETLYKHLKPDYAVFGEGEEILFELLSGLDNNKDVKTLEGLVYTDNGEVKYNKKVHFFSDMNVNFSEDLVDFYWNHSGMLNIQTKRGCPLKCVYCTYPVIEGRKVRKLNVDSVIENLSELYHKKGIDYIFFTDSVFNIDNNYNTVLAEKLIANKINIKWGAYFYPKGLTEEHLKLLKASGLEHIEFGTESISDITLEKYGKHFTVSDIIQQSEICTKLKIDFAHFMLLGGYGETDKTLDETFENSKRIGPTVFFPFVGMRIYPGTKLFDISVKEGVIDNDDDLIEPKYYISQNITQSTIKKRAKATEKRWIFPDEDTSMITNRLRIMRNKKGPLWEYLII
jgi:radical SAM superfamily enzyme YgiQ (UPF0313 family)